MLLRAVIVLLALTVLTPTPVLSASEQVTVGSTQTERPSTVDSDRTVPTINDFLPEDRGLGECISAVPKPGCGSESRGGWHQQLVLLAIVAGLGVIGWRIWAGARKARPEPQHETAKGTRDDT